MMTDEMIVVRNGRDIDDLSQYSYCNITWLAKKSIISASELHDATLTITGRNAKAVLYADNCNILVDTADIYSMRIIGCKNRIFIRVKYVFDNIDIIGDNNFVDMNANGIAVSIIGNNNFILGQSLDNSSLFIKGTGVTTNVSVSNSIVSLRLKKSIIDFKGSCSEFSLDGLEVQGNIYSLGDDVSLSIRNIIREPMPIMIEGNIRVKLSEGVELDTRGNNNSELRYTLETLSSMYKPDRSGFYHFINGVPIE